MSTSVDTLISNLRYRLSDETDTAYSSTMLLNAANEGARIFATTTGCNQIDEDVTGEDASEYSLAIGALNSGSYPTKELVNVYAVELDGAALYWAPKSEAVKWAPTTGTATGWNVWANTLYFDYTVTSSSTFTLHYTYSPTALTATSGNLDIPDRWMPAIEAYMRYVIHEKNRDETLAAGAFAEFESIRNTAAKVYEAQMSGGGYS
jgi:hypothetical protein